MSYTFIDANGATQTAASSIINGAQQPLVQVQGSVITVSAPNSNQSVSGTVNIAGNPSVSGTVGASIIGLPQVALQDFATTTGIVGKADNVDGATTSSGVVNLATLSRNTVFNGATWDRMPGNTTGVFVTTKNSSVIAFIQGSVAAVQSGIWATSMVGVASVTQAGAWNVGLLGSVLSANYLQRNDTVASALGVDLTYRPFIGDSAGRTIIKPFAANESSIFGHASTLNSGDASSVLLVGPAGTGLKNYITDYQVSNTGASTTLVTFTEGGASILGRTIAPAGGGSNMPGMSWPISNIVPNQPINLVTSSSSSVLYISFRGFKAP